MFKVQTFNGRVTLLSCCVLYLSKERRMHAIILTVYLTIKSILLNFSDTMSYASSCLYLFKTSNFVSLRKIIFYYLLAVLI